jgi:ribosomal protein S18 acetylase RimI-like enzyme
MDRVEFRVVGPGDARLLADLFAEIDETFFRPHPFTPEQAREIAHTTGHDIHAVLIADERAIAYGLLRGWDEGYATPSIGLAVRPDSQGRGMGRVMMTHLHAAAKSRGASSVRLRVHPENSRARRLYETLGYTYGDEDRGELVMQLRLDPGHDARSERVLRWPVGAERGPALTLQLLRPDDPAWDESLLSIPRSIFHTAGYHTYARGSGDGDPYLAIVGDSRRGLAWPYLLRTVAGVPGLEASDACDVYSVYGYSGPLAWGWRPGDAFGQQAWDLLLDTWRHQNAVSVFTRFHPLLENAQFIHELASRPSQDAVTEGVVAVGPTISIDLTLTDEAVRGDYGRGLARDIAIARRAGLTTRHDEDLSLLPTFTRLYHETMARVGASDYYYFSEDDFRRLRDALDGRLHLLATFVGDSVAAAGLFIEYGGIVEWHLVGSSQEFSHLSPSKVLVEDAIAWARDRGNRTFHMGGGHGGREDSLFWFKSRFSRTRHLFHTGRWILEPRLYAELVEARLETTQQDSLDPDFFPTYRAPAHPDHAA